jgi:hypothetical protein
LWAKIRPISPGGTAAWQEALLKEYAIHSHLIDSGTAGVNYADLEADIEVAVNDVAAWQGLHAFSGFVLWRDMAEPLRELCLFERVALWESV